MKAIALVNILGDVLLVKCTLMHNLEKRKTVQLRPPIELSSGQKSKLDPKLRYNSSVTASGFDVPIISIESIYIIMKIRFERRFFCSSYCLL